MSIKRRLQGAVLNLQQKRVDRKYEKEGLSDSVLEKQVQINKKRNSLDISETGEGEFVQ